MNIVFCDVYIDFDGFDFFLSIMVLLWSSEAFPVGGSVGGASHARQRPMRTLQLHQ